MLQFFHRLRVSQKLMLISILFMIPDSVLLCLFLLSINDNIHFARWEKLGNQYQRPLEELLEFLPSHLLAVRKGATPEQVQTLTAKIDAAVSRLEEVDARIGANLQFTDEGLAKRNRSHFRAHTLKEEWEGLKAVGPKIDTEVITARHLHLLADVRTMITHAGDNSNLILDPDLDSYYLMDVTLLALPEMQDRLWNVAAYGADLLDKKTLTTAEHSQMAAYAALLKESDLDRVLQSARTALNEDANFYGASPLLQQRLPSVLNDFKKAADEFIGLTERISQAERSELTHEEFLASGMKAHAASFALWTLASEELDRLLDARIHYYRMRRARSLCLTALALMAAIGFVTFITRSISQPLQKQADDLRGFNTALKEEIAERQRIEAALRSAEEKYRSIFENSIEGIFQTTKEGIYLVANPTLARMYGYESVEALQREMTDISKSLYVEPGRRAEFQKQIEQHGLVERFESAIYRKDKSTLWISENARGVDDERGKFLYYEGTVQDITERKRNEAALEKANKDLLDASRLAGMAEVATGILHNVGNVLNSVNVSANFIADAFQKSKVKNLTKVASLLKEHSADLASYLTADPKGKQLPEYIVGLAAHLAAEQETLTAKMEQLRKHLDHTKQIVAMQQDYAKMGGVVEIIKVEDMIEDALRLNAAGLNRHAVEVRREFEPLPALTLNKHKALQILVNLIRNAEHACATSERPDKQLVIKAANGNGGVKISVRDNGVGIPPENMVRIFSHGFTTKEDGHGFGLHSGALAAKEIGGALRAQSDGAGLGATFTLELPLCAATSNARSN